MTYWLFQGNPKYYRIIDAIRDFEQMPWLATRYANNMSPGDGVLIWKAGDKAGIYAIVEIIESPKIITNPPDVGYWIDTSIERRVEGVINLFLAKNPPGVTDDSELPAFF